MAMISSGAGKARSSGARQDLTPSRLVENLYWMGRYTVRCEDKAGLLRATLAVRVDPQVWRSGVRMCQDLDVIAADSDPMTSLRARSPERLFARPCSARACRSRHSSRDICFPPANDALVETIHAYPKYDSILTQ